MTTPKIEVLSDHVVVLSISELDGLDPITAYLHDIRPGMGSVTVTCYGSSWTAWWGAMGDRTIVQFMKDCDACYVCKNLASPDRKDTTKEQRYRLKVSEALINALKSEFRGDA